MDDYNRVVMAAFEDELEKIAEAELEKTAGWTSFLSKGFKNLGTIGKRSLGQHKDLITKLYQRGAKGGGGVWGGIKQVARSPYGSMAAAAGTTGLAGYGAYKALGGGRPAQRQPGY